MEKYANMCSVMRGTAVICIQDNVQKHSFIPCFKAHNANSGRPYCLSHSFPISELNKTYIYIHPVYIHSLV